MKQVIQFLVFGTSLLSVSPPVLCAEHQSPEATAPASNVLPTFDMLEMQVDGNSVLEQQLVEKTLYPFLGPKKTVDDVEHARQALEAVYKNKGYPTVLVEIPEQDVEDALVRLKVIEGTIERLKITGSRYFLLGKIRAKVPALAVGQVPYMPIVQEQVNELSQESPDRRITPIFRAGITPGTTEVELRVNDALPVHGSVEINGRNSESTSRSRLVAALRYDNLWQRFHSASLSYQVSPENNEEVEVWSGTYVLPTGVADSRLVMYGVGINSMTQLGANIGNLSVLGTGEIYGLRLLKPLVGLAAYSHNVTLGVDYKNFTQGVTQQGQDQHTSPIQYLPLLLSYDSSWRYPNGTTSLTTALHFSVAGLGNDQHAFDKRRAEAKAGFAYLTTELKQLHELPGDLRLAARFLGQLTSTPLISNEQFAVGGQQSVRGYYQSQQLGDDGLNVSLELHSPQWQAKSWDVAHALRAHLFFDYASLWIDHALAPSPSTYQLAGTGVGLRLQLFKRWFGEFDWAYPLVKQGTVSVGSQRVDFRLAYEF